MATDKPWWMRQRRFAVPTTLRDRIDGLPEEERRFYCYIVNKVVITTKKRPNLFRGISRGYFKNFIGSDYRDYIDRLREWQIIEVNEPYLTTENVGFPKSYRLHPTAQAADKVKIVFDKNVVQPLRDKSVLTDEVTEFVFRNIQRIGVRSELLEQSNVVDEVEAFEWANIVASGKFNVHYSGKTKRLYHTLINMPRIARRNLVLKDKPATPLFEYDVKSCAPVILLGATKDPGERANLVSMLEGDIYTTIANDTGVTKDRDVIKEDFMMFLNGGVENYVYTFFRRHMPILTELVLRQRKVEKGMAWFGQRVESEIMVQEVPRVLIQFESRGAAAVPSTNTSTKSLINPLTCGGNSEEILYIPMHDGWLGIEGDEDRIAEVVRERFYKRIGYWVTITKTPVTGGDKAVLSAERQPVAVEPPTRHQ